MTQQAGGEQAGGEPVSEGVDQQLDAGLPDESPLDTDADPDPTSEKQRSDPDDPEGAIKQTAQLSQEPPD